MRVRVVSAFLARGATLGVGVSGLVLLAALPYSEAVEIVRRNARKLQALNDIAAVSVHYNLAPCKEQPWQSPQLPPKARRRFPPM
jgi:hypothetical protein